jgi:hypothetical protein
MSNTKILAGVIITAVLITGGAGVAVAAGVSQPSRPSQIVDDHGGSRGVSDDSTSSSTPRPVPSTTTAPALPVPSTQLPSSPSPSSPSPSGRPRVDDNPHPDDNPHLGDDGRHREAEVGDDHGGDRGGDDDHTGRGGHDDGPNHQ